jgi:hypothetical protein
MLTLNGVALREAPHDIPTRCYCCSPRQRLSVFRNGPTTQLAVCPRSRAALIIKDDHPAIGAGHYTGSLNGV